MPHGERAVYRGAGGGGAGKGTSTNTLGGQARRTTGEGEKSRATAQEIRC